MAPGLASSQYQIDPETGLPIDPQTGRPVSSAAAPIGPYAAGPGAPQSQSVYGSPQNAVIPGTIADPEAPMQNRYTQNQNIINSLGTQINNEAQYQMGYYGDLIPKYQSQMDEQLANLRGTPGYTGDEASKIGVDYGQFQTTPDEYSSIMGNPREAQRKTEEGVAGEGAMLNQYQQNLGGQLGEYSKNVGGATDQYGKELGGAFGQYDTGVRGAVGGLKTGLEGAQNWDMLNSAVNSKGLNFDPNGTQKQLTDADVQAMKTAAGTRIGNQYRNAEDLLERQAAEAGNTSPIALAAARARLMSQEAADQGDSEAAADIAAKQAQYQRAAGIEGQRLGAEQTISGLRAAAGTTQEQAAQAAAGLAGTADIAANENIGAAGLNTANAIGQQRIGSAANIGQQGINAANTYGAQSIATQSDIARQQAGAAANADAAAAARGLAAAGMRYGQGTQTAGLNAAGAQTIGDARRIGEGALRGGLTGQQQFAQQGGNQAATQQNQAYATQTGGLNSSAAAQGQFINGKQSFGDELASGVAKGLTSFIRPPSIPGSAKGEMIRGSEVRRIAESGPEYVQSLGGRYGQLVTKPTIARLTNEKVIPLNGKAGNRVNADAIEGRPKRSAAMRYSHQHGY